MNTPIYDFITSYNSQQAVRMHMPGHKGVDSLLGVEHLDITEFDGADNLWEASGIIAESESNASSLFGCPTFYSTEGSSLAIRGMLFLIKKWSHINGVRPLILAARNAHKTLIYTAAILDLDIDWLMQKQSDSYQSCTVTAEDVAEYLDLVSGTDRMPIALYLTSPDYLGNISDIRSIADVCHSRGVFLLVDNAHGAYLKFLGSSSESCPAHAENHPLHPIDLGADMCCDSAHKTLPVLTGGAYLHVRGVNTKALQFFADNAKSAMALFGSTSPSYLIMQSLDLCNAYLADNMSAYDETALRVHQIKSELTAAGYVLKGSEPIKITIDTKAYGYSGHEISECLVNKDIYVEYHDDDYIVFMITPMTTDEELAVLKDALTVLPKRIPVDSAKAADFSCEDSNPQDCSSSANTNDARIPCPEQAMSYMEAILSDSETVPVAESMGRILAEPAISTPPCVPVCMCGERIDSQLPLDEVRVVIE